MFCTQCGARLGDTARYCSTCGKPAGPSFTPSDSFAGIAVEPARKLRRIRSRKKIAGVCAGFAEYFDMDVTWMRIIWVALLVLPPAIGLFAYIVAWIVLPIDRS